MLTELGEHFQAGRLTSEELDERTGRALQARTFGELAPLTAHLPALTADSPQPGTAERVWPRPPVLVPVVLGLVAVAAVVVAFSGHGTGDRGMQLLWLILVVPLLARRMAARGRR